MDGPGRVEGGMKIQGMELYPEPNAGPGAELHSAAKPEKLRQANQHSDARGS